MIDQLPIIQVFISVNNVAELFQGELLFHEDFSVVEDGLDNRLDTLNQL